MANKWHLNFGNLFYLIELITCTSRADISDCVDILNETYHYNYSFDKTNYSKMKSGERKVFRYFYDERDKLVPILCKQLFTTDVVKMKFMDILYIFYNKTESFNKDIWTNLHTYNELKDINSFLLTLFEVANFTPFGTLSLFKNKISISDILSVDTDSNVTYAETTSLPESHSLPSDDFIERSDIFHKLWDDIFHSDKNITFIYGLSGNGKSSLALDIFHNISGNHKFWFSAKLRSNDLTIDYIVNEMLIAFGYKNPTTLTFTEKELEMNKILPSINVIVLDDIEKSPERESLLSWVVSCNENYPHIKFIITCQNAPILLFSTEANSLEPEELKSIINSEKISGLDESQTTILISKLLNKTEHLKAIVANDNDVLSKVSNQVFKRTNGNPQAIKSSIAYIENMISCGNSLEVILSNNTLLGSVRNMFTYMWEHLLDDYVKKIIATVALLYTETSAKRIAEITQIPGMQENNIIQAGSELGKAFASAIGSSMIELKIHLNGNIFYTQHGLVFDFITELLVNKRSKTVQLINQAITEWYLTTCDNIQICFDNPDKLKFLDNEINCIFNIMRRCYSFGDYQTVIKFANSTRYYTLIRAIYNDSPTSIHNLIISAAEHLNDKNSKFKQLVCALNILSRKRELTKATELFMLLKTNEKYFLEDMDLKLIFRYNHAQAIYYYMNNDYAKALELWKNNEALYEKLQHVEKNGEVNSCLMWTAKCYKHMSNFINARKYYTMANNNAIEYGLVRSYINSSLRLIEVDILDNNDVLEPINIVNRLDNLDHHVISFNENKFIALWNFLYAKALYLSNNNTCSDKVEFFANKAYNIYTSMGFLKKQSTIKQWLASIK